MIGTISGLVQSKNPNTLIVDVGGLGYKVFVPTDTILEAKEGSKITLFTHLSVKENALDLFGFSEKDTLHVFELLIGISGIGPRTALSILNVATPSMLRQAVASDDTSQLTRISGIGKKNAEKIVLELRDKLVTSSEDKRSDLQADGDVAEALLSLGYSDRDIREVLKKLPKEEGTASARVKQALKILSEKNG